MTLYLFEDVKTKDEVVLEFETGTAPGLFHEIRRMGRRLRRLPGEAGVEIQVQRDLTDQPDGALVSQSLPLNWPWAPRTDSKGRAVFLSHREAQESVKKAKDAGEYIQAYDSPYGK